MTSNLNKTEIVKTYQCPACKSSARFGIITKESSATKISNSEIAVELGGALKTAHFMTVDGLDAQNKQCRAELAICESCGTVYAWRTTKLDDGKQGFSVANTKGIQIDMGNMR